MATRKETVKACDGQRIFSGDSSVKMWKEINGAKTVRDLRMALYVVCCRLQELEEKVERKTSAAPLSGIKALSTKPPLGLRPRWIAEEQRLIEVASAASRYLEAGKTVPPPWIEEMIHLIRGIE